MSITLKTKFKKILMCSISAIALSGVAGVSIAQANHDYYRTLAVKTHSGQTNTNPTVSKIDILKRNIKNDEQALSKAKGRLKNAKSSKKKREIKILIDKYKEKLKSDNAILNKSKSKKSKKSKKSNKIKHSSSDK
ncbi:hypothetical protein [Lentilactobacillus parakefiri]|uniref:Uncharacterized protein n=1 Tax=Lentilactobacillus parakefiri TaxID=152332 RepID=A0A224V9K9_9LACO|nr:hypothetical protein [Lentilactobacillus parakefiri]TDG92716.1 hypothetical protein C5L28_002282 [Lentilactobacillus parakefiri]GAW71525.1 hypothetical protein LPKJCM_00606 [Lentilactobacillus parakefiri]